MARKKTYTLDAQEHEIGAVIDQSINGETNKPTAVQPIRQEADADKVLLPSQLHPRETRNMIKQLWLDEDIYNKCVEVQASRKQRKLPGSFDALAYDAIVHYLDYLGKQEM